MICETLETRVSNYIQWLEMKLRTNEKTDTLEIIGELSWLLNDWRNNCG